MIKGLAAIATLATLLPASPVLALPPAAPTEQGAALPPDTDTDAYVRTFVDDPTRLDLAALRQDFPAVFAKIEADFRLEIEQRKLGGSAAEEAYRRGFNQGPATYRQWLAENIHHLSHAPDDAAAGILADQTDVFGHLAKIDARQCAIYAMTQDIRGFPQGDTELLRLLMVMSADTIKAIKLALTDPNPDNEMTEADAVAMADAALAAGIQQSEIDMALSEDLPKASPEDQCISAIVLNGAVLHLKGAQRGRVARSFLTR